MLREIAGYLWDFFKKLNSGEKYEDNPESYAYGINKYKLMWLMVLGSIMGFLLETAWYYILRGHFVNRQGVLYGPFSPIYGVAIATFTCCLYKVRTLNSWHIFLTGGILGGVFEYICSFLQERILGTISWDYSRKPFNINGRICLEFAIYWGILGVIIIKHTYPFLSKIIEGLSEKVGKYVGTALFVFLAFDCVLSVAVSKRQFDRREGLEPANKLEAYFDVKYPDEVLDKIYTEIRVVE